MSHKPVFFLSHYHPSVLMVTQPFCFTGCDCENLCDCYVHDLQDQRTQWKDQIIIPQPAFQPVVLIISNCCLAVNVGCRSVLIVLCNFSWPHVKHKDSICQLISNVMKDFWKLCRPAQDAPRLSPKDCLKRQKLWRKQGMEIKTLWKGNFSHMLNNLSVELVLFLINLKHLLS